MKARVFVTLKPSVFDPQGHTITEALHQMGYGGVDDVRRREAKVQVSGRFPHVLGHGCRKRDHIVVGRLLDLPVISQTASTTSGCAFPT